MTYRKSGYGETPLVGTGFGEFAYVREGTAYLDNVVGGGIIVPYQPHGHAESAFGGGGGASRVQTTPLEWNGMPQEPIVRFTGICHHPYVESLAEGKHVLVRVDLETGQTLEIDMAAHTVRRDGEMVWGYTGRWFSVKPGDLVQAGAEGIGAGFSAEIDLRDTGLVTKSSAGVGVLSLFATGAYE